jgi:hypothetical protein
MIWKIKIVKIKMGLEKELDKLQDQEVKDIFVRKQRKNKRGKNKSIN